MRNISCKTEDADVGFSETMKPKTTLTLSGHEITMISRLRQNYNLTQVLPGPIRQPRSPLQSLYVPLLCRCYTRCPFDIALLPKDHPNALEVVSLRNVGIRRLGSARTRNPVFPEQTESARTIFRAINAHRTRNLASWLRAAGREARYADLGARGQDSD